MGTRADFYIGEGKAAQWLGSIAWDGYPDGIDKEVLEATDKDDFINSLENFFEDRRDVTSPQMGWPWPWDDSRTTDYAYALIDGKVMASCFGCEWFDPLNEPEELPEGQAVEFPNMKHLQNVDFGERSGVIIISHQTEVPPIVKALKKVVE